MNTHKRVHSERAIAKAIIEAREALIIVLNMVDDNAATTQLKYRQGREGDRTDRILEAMSALRAADALTLRGK
jgi:hypothetical protein